MEINKPSISALSSRDINPIFTVLNTPVKIKLGFFINLLGLWAAMSWLTGRRRPERRWPTQMVVGALSASALVLSDVGHAFAHILSARIAGAPMDEIRLSSGMPRTIYYDNSVLPRAHRLRALGGPVFSTLGLGLSLLLRTLTPRDSAIREVADWSSVGHGLILTGSLAPLPIVDGGSILKWTLVEQGRSPEQADQVVKQAGLITGLAVSGAGVGLATRRRWLPAVGMLAAGAIAVGAALGKIR
jgi:hypothetical protein